MRLIIQVVNKASVEIDNKLHSSINEGLLVFVGFTQDDDKQTVDKVIDKLIHLRIFKDENDKTNLSLIDVKGELLSVSQFTLYADLKKGRRPSFINALGGEAANNLYDYFNHRLKQLLPVVKTGVFGAEMKVFIENNGPFTVYLDSNDL